MVEKTKIAFDTISRMLAILRYDIEHHQKINDFSLNIHGENFFRDVFNHVYGHSYINANIEDMNAAYIDLVDHTNKKIIQITTTRNKQKIEKSLDGLLDKKYKGYEISIFYLLEKANPSANSRKEIEKKYTVNLDQVLLDYTDLIRDINNLESDRLIDLCERYFQKLENRFTPEIVLDLVCKKLVKDKCKIKPYYDDDLGSIEVKKKLKINKVNDRVSSHINQSLDFTPLIDDDLAKSLRDLIIEGWYKNILVKNIESFVPESDVVNLSVDDIQKKAIDLNIDVNKLVCKLKDKVESVIEVDDFNAMNISWVLVSYFFEICDVGKKCNGTT